MRYSRPPLGFKGIHLYYLYLLASGVNRYLFAEEACTYASLRRTPFSGGTLDYDFGWDARITEMHLIDLGEMEMAIATSNVITVKQCVRTDPCFLSQ